MAAIKDEARYLDEWLAFCVLQGVEHVLLYDNSSSDNTREVLEPWIDAGIVELIDWPIHWKNKAQTKAYADALRRLRGRTRWAAFIDPDEFLFSPTGKRVAEVLKEYERYAGVIVNWQCYGSSGHAQSPPGLTVEGFTRRARTSWARNRRVKTIVDPSLAIHPEGSHLFKVAPGTTLVTEDFRPVRISRSVKLPRGIRHLTARLPYLPFDPYSTKTPSPGRVSVNHLRINHYVTRSRDEVAFKYKDRASMRLADRHSHARYHDRNEVEDPILVSQAPFVRQIIARIRSGDAPFAGEWLIRVQQASAYELSRPAERRELAPSRGLMPALKTSAQRVRREMVVLWLAARDRRVPWYAKALAAITGAYPVWPIDFIPDVVPILGYLDDIVIVALGIVVATRLIPADVIADLRLQASRG